MSTLHNLPHKIALIGNPLVGKSRIFELLTKSEAGETDLAGSSLSIEEKSLKFSNIDDKKYIIVDTPGINGLFSQEVSEHETREYLISDNYDSILFVMDAKNIRRSLALFFQITLLNKPVIIVVNMIDEADKLGHEIDIVRLNKILNVPVFKTIATNANTFREISQGLDSFTLFEPSPFKTVLGDYTHFISTINDLTDPIKNLALLFIAQIPEVENRLKSIDEALVALLEEERRKLANNNPFKRMDIFLTDQTFSLSEEIRREVVIEKEREKSILYKFGKWSMKPASGVPIAIFMLFLMYLWVGKFGATFLVDLVDQKLFAQYLVPWTTSLLSYIPWKIVRDAFIDPNFGIVTTGIFLAFGIVLPVLTTYYLFVGFLEDIGYFPRLSVLLDRTMRPIGLSGKGVMPLLMGFSCITMAIVTTRVLKTRKERIIATLLLILGVPCAPLLSTMFIILGRMHWTATLLLFGIIFSQIIIAGFLANKVIKGTIPQFIQEIPPIRPPDFSKILNKTIIRTWIFIKEALPLFIFASLLLFIAQRVGFLIWLEKVTSPLVSNIWGLPKESVQVLIKTMIRRENGVAELARVKQAFSPTQSITIMLLMTFLLPCVNSTLMMIKERGVKISVAIILTVFIYASIVAAIVNLILRTGNFTF